MKNDSQVIRIAQRQAKRLGDSFVDTGHLLIGIIEDGPNLTSYLLGCSGATRRLVLIELQKFQSDSDKHFSGELPYTPAMKHVLKGSWDAARQLGQNKISTEHVLLGLLSLDEGMAATIFENLNVDVDALRQDVVNILSPSSK